MILTPAPEIIDFSHLISNISWTKQNMHIELYFWNHQKISRRLVYCMMNFEKLQKILRLAGGQKTIGSSAMKIASKNHQKKSVSVLP